MTNRAQSIVLSSCAFIGAWMLGPAAAHAELDACGGIFLEGGAACEYQPTEKCMTQCVTVAVEHSCVAQIYGGCETSCTVSATVDCESSCTQACVDECTTTSTTEQGTSCNELCLSDCDGAAGGGANCESAMHKGPCGRCAKHNCDKKCEKKCGDASAPTKVTTVTQCMPTCTSSCSASCTAKANAQCQVDCQEQTYVQCEQTMVEHCKTECKQTGGAIFCDGQFINASNLNSCADELRAKVKIDVNITASVSAAASKTKAAANTAGQTAGQTVSKVCAVTDVGTSRGRGALGALFSLAFVASWRMVRRRGRRG